MQKTSWHKFEISPDQTHHIVDGASVYDARFLTVLKFHAPGFAPVLDLEGAYHIDSDGKAAYPYRFLRTFGFYENRAAVQSEEGWYHILPDGSELYPERYLWCGNFQQNHSSVKDFNGRFFHLNLEGKKAYPGSFKYAGDFRDGYASVQDDLGLYTHIDSTGGFLHGKKFLDLDVFHKGFARAKDKKGWFHINRQGDPIYLHRFRNVEPFYNGVARVETYTGAIHLIQESGELATVVREELEDEFHQVSAELVSYWRYYTLDAACALKVFDLLPTTIPILSQKLSLPQRSIEKLLKALAEMGFVKQSMKDLWNSSKKGEFLTSRHPFSLLNAQKLWKEEHLQSWQHLLESLKTESPAFIQLYGKSWFDYLNSSVEKNNLYHQALSIYAKRDYRAFSSCTNLNFHRSIVDIGGSSGTLMLELLEATPHLHGIILDLPSVTQLIQIPDHLKQRLTLMPVNFFDPWPAFRADGAILSRVLHDWSDQNCIEILKKIRQVLSDDSDHRLYILENLLNHDDCSGSLLDLNMFVMTEGKERTLDCFEEMLAKAGFVLEKTCPLNEVSTILIARKSYE